MKGASEPPPLSALYLCYLSLDDPLVHTQVVAYLTGLARLGHTIHLLTYEPKMLRARRRAVRREMQRQGISWHRLTYHKRPSLPATIFDALAGALVGTWLVVRHRLEAVHCRSHVPAATGLLVTRLTGTHLIFDLRGLMAEEYEDAGLWTRESAGFRITKWIEGVAIRRAAGIVVLTHKVAGMLFGPQGDPRVHVIPCCADLERIAAAASRREEVRAALGVGQDPVLIYVGKFTGWYMHEEMAELFAVARKRRPSLHLLVLTQVEPGPITIELARHGVPLDAVTILSASSEDVPGYLAAADLAMALIRPLPSKASSSPTKIGEYLGAGLPVVAMAGIGDCDELFANEGAGILLDLPITRDALVNAVERLLVLTADVEGADRRRRLAARELSLTGRGIPAYAALYRQVASHADPPDREGPVIAPLA